MTQGSTGGGGGVSRIHQRTSSKHRCPGEARSRKMIHNNYKAANVFHDGQKRTCCGNDLLHRQFTIT